MTNGSGSSRLLSGRLGLLLMVVVIVIALPLVFASGWCLGGGIWRGEVRVMEVRLSSSNWLELVVASCNGNPAASVLQQTDRDVHVKVTASSTPLRGGCDGVDVVGVRLQEPLGDRTVIDRHTGQEVVVIRVNP